VPSRLNLRRIIALSSDKAFAASSLSGAGIKFATEPDVVTRDPGETLQ
jgi:hypothetical protein